jgi:hypothetical protein
MTPRAVILLAANSSVRRPTLSRGPRYLALGCAADAPPGVRLRILDTTPDRTGYVVKLHSAK